MREFLFFFSEFGGRACSWVNSIILFGFTGLDPAVAFEP